MMTFLFLYIHEGMVFGMICLIDIDTFLRQKNASVHCLIFAIEFFSSILSGAWLWMSFGCYQLTDRFFVNFSLRCLAYASIRNVVYVMMNSII